MKKYRVDLRGLTPAEREAVYKQIDSLAFMTDRVLGSTGLEAMDVFLKADDEPSLSQAHPSGVLVYSDSVICFSSAGQRTH